MKFSVASFLDLGWEWFSAVMSMTEQSFLGSTLLTRKREGARKGALNIGRPTITCLGNRTQGVSPVCGHKTKKEDTLQIGTWNVRTLLDNNPNRPERRPAFVASGLQRNKIGIVALAET